MPRPPRFNDEVIRLARQMVRGVAPGVASDDVKRPREGVVVTEEQGPGRFIDVGPDLYSPPTHRRILIMPRRVRASSRSRSAYGDPVFTWSFRSSQPRGGQIIQYETRLEEDGILRCNCPGWVFCKIEKDSKGNPVAPKVCKHTNMVKDEAPDVLRRFRSGEELPLLDIDQVAISTGTTTGRFSSRTTNISNRPKTGSEVENTRARYGRVIEI